MDLSGQIVKSMIDNWPLVVGMAILGKWTLPWAIKISLDKYFSNGGGEKLRLIVKEENEAQSRSQKDELDRRFREHNDRQEERFRAGDARFREIEQRLNRPRRSR